MKSEHKIFLDREEKLETIVERLINAKSDKVIFNIPRGSVFGSMLHNFQILKREAITAGKDLTIESIDDRVLELAGLSKIEAKNPVFRLREKVISDILPRPIFTKKDNEFFDIIDREKIAHNPTTAGVPEEKKEKTPMFVRSEAGAPIIKRVGKEEKAIFEPPPKPPIEKKLKARMSSRKKLTIILICFFVLFVAFELVFYILPRATIKLTLKKTPIVFNNLVEVSSKTAITKFDSSGKIFLPGEMLSAKRNLEMSFPAHGKENNVATKASGQLIVYNATSSLQTFVATTRFESPDKKIFRIDKPITLPAGKLVNGKLQPSETEVIVMADQPGDSYNIASSSGWRVPGLKDNPKYDYFYAASVGPMTGGFTGVSIAPTVADIALAKSVIEMALSDALKSQILITLSKKFKLLDGAASFNILSEEVKLKADAAGNFSIFAEAQMRELVFKEVMLREAIIGMVVDAEASSSLEMIDFKLNYGTTTVDFSQSKLNFNISGSATLETKFDLEKFKASILHADETALRPIIYGLPGVEKADIQLWPFWVKKIPANSGKVELIVE